MEIEVQSKYKIWNTNIKGERLIDWSWSSASERPGIGQWITNANGNWNTIIIQTLKYKYEMDYKYEWKSKYNQNTKYEIQI